MANHPNRSKRTHKKYRVGLVQSVAEEATVYIYAATAEEAERLALEMADAGTVEWHLLDAFEPVEIVTIDEIAETTPAETNSPDA